MNNKKNDYTHETLRHFFIESENNKNKEKFFLGEKYEDGSREKPESQNYSNNIKLFEHIISTFALPDMTRRGNIPNAKEKLTKNGSLEELAKRINELLSSSTETFDEWHKKACNMLTTKNEDVNLKYGQAQKLVNMSLKYIYCLKDFEDFCSVKLDDWHMTLDSYTLDWIANNIYEPRKSLSDEKAKELYKELKDCIPESKTNTNKKWKTVSNYSEFTNNIKWNNLDKDSYYFLQNEVKKFLQSPFKEEFYIWAETQIDILQSEIIKDLNSIIKYKEIINKLSINRKICDIESIEETISNKIKELKEIKF